MTSEERERYVVYMTVKEELESAKDRGIELSLKGRTSSPHEIAKACAFEEESSYMRDYISDKTKKCTMLNFDLVHNS